MECSIQVQEADDRLPGLCALHDYQIDLSIPGIITHKDKGYFSVEGRGIDSATANIMTQRGKSLAILQNIALPEYRKTDFGSGDVESVASAVARYRKRVRELVISRSRIEKLVDIDKKMKLSDRLNQNRSADEMISIAYSSRGK